MGQQTRLKRTELLFTARLTTAAGVWQELSAVWVSLWAEDGGLQLFAGHAPLVTVMQDGPLRIMTATSSTPTLFYGKAGLVHVQPKLVTFFSTHFEALTLTKADARKTAYNPKLAAPSHFTWSPDA
jgi:F0F1-type ATP synthase epsilon subunit